MSKEEILLVEDEMPMAVMIQETISDLGCEVVHVSTATEGYKFAQSLRPALIITDVGLPDEDGFTLCKKIREHPLIASTPIIILSARDKFRDKVSGFTAGADHYLVKPLQIKELNLWANALLHRFKYVEQNNGILQVDSSVLDPKTHRVITGTQVVSTLTRKEFDLLYLLMLNQRKTFSNKDILITLWMTTTLAEDVVNNHIKNIRDKLGPLGRRIATIPNVGYEFI